MVLIGRIQRISGQLGWLRASDGEVWTFHTEDSEPGVSLEAGDQIEFDGDLSSHRGLVARGLKVVSFVDAERSCVQCATRFVITADARAWFRAKGFPIPRRCSPCRAERRLAAGEQL